VAHLKQTFKSNIITIGVINKIKYRFENSKLYLKDKLIEFQDYLIFNAISSENLVFVILYQTKTAKDLLFPKDNIYAINSEGEVQWCIGDTISNNIYSAFRLENEDLVIIDALGHNYKIDVTNKTFGFTGMSQ